MQVGLRPRSRQLLENRLLARERAEDRRRRSIRLHVILVANAENDLHDVEEVTRRERGLQCRRNSLVNVLQRPTRWKILSTSWVEFL